MNIKVGDKVRIFYEDKGLREECTDHDEVGVVVRFPWKPGNLYNEIAEVSFGTIRRPYNIGHLIRMDKQC